VRAGKPKEKIDKAEKKRKKDKKKIKKELKRSQGAWADAYCVPDDSQFRFSPPLASPPLAVSDLVRAQATV
jgi:hypothetical protein